MQSLTGDDSLEFWHYRFGDLNVKDVHIFQNMISDMNLGNTPHPRYFVKCASKTNNIRLFFSNEGEGEQQSFWKLCIPMCVAPLGLHSRAV